MVINLCSELCSLCVESKHRQTLCWEFITWAIFTCPRMTHFEYLMRSQVAKTKAPAIILISLVFYMVTKQSLKFDCSPVYKLFSLNSCGEKKLLVFTRSPVAHINWQVCKCTYQGATNIIKSDLTASIQENLS